MKKTFLLLFLLFVCMIATNAQMNTDNSYLRENYSKSKTAKKAAEKKARKLARKAEKQKAKEQSRIYYNAKQPTESTTAYPDALYLEGAVPTTQEGIVCFEKNFTSATKNKQQLYDLLKDFANEKISETQNLEISRILSESPDTIIATICEPLYFKRKKWESDSTIIQYQYFATVKDNTASVRIWFISYCYEQSREFGFNYKAEEWITDQYALSKNKRALLKAPGKFRKKTIDYINMLFNEIEQKIQ